MIRYALICGKGHTFESWFQNSTTYDKQVKRGLVGCPICGDSKVEKAIMSPRLNATKKRKSAAPTPAVSPAAAATPDDAGTPVAIVQPAGA